MKVEHPRTIDKFLHKKFHDESNNSCLNIKDEPLDNKLKTPTKLSSNYSTPSSAKKLNVISVNSSNYTKDSRNNNDDSDIVQGSQSSNESTLRKKSRILNLSQESRQNISNFCDVSFSEVKEELDLDLVLSDDFKPIELNHDLNGLFTDDKLSNNVLQFSPPIVGHSVNVESISEDDKLENEIQDDPLQIHESDINENKEIVTKTRLSSYNSSKKILKSTSKSKKKCNSEFQSTNIKKELSNNLSQRLKYLTIKMQHEVPPQHKIENCAGSRALNIYQVKLFKSYGPLKTGTYVKDEDEIIKKNWESFCKNHKWDPKIVWPFMSMRRNKKYHIKSLQERKHFVQYLANGLPWRSLFSVYSRFKLLYNGSKSGKFSGKEDKIILSNLSELSKNTISKYSEVANLLNRSVRSIYIRYKKLKLIYDVKQFPIRDFHTSDSDSEDNIVNERIKRKKIRKKKSHSTVRKLDNEDDIEVYTKVNWSTIVVENLIQNIVEVTSCDKLEELKYKIIDDDLWLDVESNLKIDNKLLKHFWNYQLHMQLFCPGPLYLNDLKMKLIEYIYEEKITNSENIIWEIVCINFDGVTKFFLMKLFRYLLNYAESKLESDKFSDMIDYLYNNYVPELKEKPIDVVLPRLYYECGKIIHVDKGTEKKMNRITNDPFSDIDM